MARGRDHPAAEVGGIRLTHPEKVLWPEDGFTKLDLARYYQRIAPVLLRYAAHRPLTLRPFPRGIQEPGFYLKDAPRGAPDWLQTFRDVAASTGQPVDFVVAHDARTLVWMAQYNVIEVHPWLSRVDEPDRPDWAVVDLDPPDTAGWEMVQRAAARVRRALDGLGLRSFPKLTGQSGVHVLLPLARTHAFEEVRLFFERLANQLAREAPDLFTTDYGTRDRGGRILLDYAQNARGKNTVAAYSVRPRRGAPVALPVTWDELAAGAVRPGDWSMRTVWQRLDRVGDLLQPALAMAQRLP